MRSGRQTRGVNLVGVPRGPAGADKDPQGGGAGAGGEGRGEGGFVETSRRTAGTHQRRKGQSHEELHRRGVRLGCEVALPFCRG